jgi:dihydroneopterin aldolase
MSTIIAVENYRLKGKHGVYDHERRKEQPFVVSVWVVLKQPAEDDTLSTSVDYGFLQRTVFEVIARGESVQMMETLCDRIIEPISGHLNVAGVKVRMRSQMPRCRTMAAWPWSSAPGPRA